MSSSSVQDIRGITLMQGEEVLHDQKPRWRAYPWSMTIGILGITAAGLGLLIIAWVWWRRQKTRFVVTNERIIQKRVSMLSQRSNEYPIRDINQLQTSGDRFNFVGSEHGSITFSVGGGGEMVTLASVRNYSAIANTIREQQRRIASE
ncbi:hypothetical protein [Halococcus thailandensis]|uniref:DUF304 domain-containing protein n=1 Tax=Halococcus thailandensis JCM 13552 TaxID=1227457 RepID=M0N746_9EURY|nr:hypothetical protein [Halococcus thailandensis]EMA52944.1 hypothetical protein C451_11005 [Halococcus thailandensis JCM 13552]